MSDSFPDDEIERLLNEEPELQRVLEEADVVFDSYLYEICEALYDAGVDLSFLGDTPPTTSGLNTLLTDVDTRAEARIRADSLFELGRCLQLWDLIGREGEIAKDLAQVFRAPLADEQSWMDACRQIFKSPQLETVTAAELRVKFGEHFSAKYGNEIIRAFIHDDIVELLRERFGEHDDLGILASHLSGAIFEGIVGDEDRKEALIQMASAHDYTGLSVADVERFVEDFTEDLLKNSDDE